MCSVVSSEQLQANKQTLDYVRDIKTGFINGEREQQQQQQLKQQLRGNNRAHPSQTQRNYTAIDPYSKRKRERGGNGATRNTDTLSALHALAQQQQLQQQHSPLAAANTVPKQLLDRLSSRYQSIPVNKLMVSPTLSSICTDPHSNEAAVGTMSASTTSPLSSPAIRQHVDNNNVHQDAFAHYVLDLEDHVQQLEQGLFTTHQHMRDVIHTYNGSTGYNTFIKHQVTEPPAIH